MPRLLWLMFQVPMSSPQMTRMFGLAAGWRAAGWPAAAAGSSRAAIERQADKRRIGKILAGAAETSEPDPATRSDPLGRLQGSRGPPTPQSRARPRRWRRAGDAGKQAAAAGGGGASAQVPEQRRDYAGLPSPAMLLVDSIRQRVAPRRWRHHQQTVELEILIGERIDSYLFRASDTFKSIPSGFPSTTASRSSSAPDCVAQKKHSPGGSRASTCSIAKPSQLLPSLGWLSNAV